MEKNGLIKWQLKTNAVLISVMWGFENKCSCNDEFLSVKGCQIASRIASMGTVLDLENLFSLTGNLCFCHLFPCVSLSSSAFQAG